MAGARRHFMKVRVLLTHLFRYGPGIRGDVPRTPNPTRVVRLHRTVPFGKVSVAVEALHLLVPLKCGMHEDEAVSLYLRTRYLIGVLLRER